MTTTWIPILLPAEHYAELATMIAQRLEDLGFDDSRSGAFNIRLDTRPSEAPDAITPAGFAAGQGKLEAHHAWSVENLRKLRASSTATAQRWVKAIDVCTDHVGEFVSTQQIVEESGMPLNVWRDACRKMRAHQRSNYPDEKDWPLAAESGRILGHSYDQLYVALTQTQADLWADAKTNRE